MNEILTSFLILLILIIISVIYFANSRPKWQQIHFMIIDGYHMGLSDEDMIVKLKERWGIINEDAQQAIEAAKNENEEWFKTKFK